MRIKKGKPKIEINLKILFSLIFNFKFSRAVNEDVKLTMQSETFINVIYTTV